MTTQPQQDDPAAFPDEAPEGIPAPSQDAGDPEETDNGTD